MTFDMTNVNGPKHTPLSTKPKTHNVAHLTEDIRRFGPALNFETEKGEQFDKYIREHLIHTNRLNTSRDVWHKFAKQAVMQHIFANGSWINSNGQREYPGPGIAEFIKPNDDKDKNFRNLFLGGSQVLADNNDTGNINTLKDNSFAAFVIKNSIGTTPSIGLISGSMVTFLRPTARTSEEMKNNYLKVEMTDDRMSLDSLKPLCRIDLMKVNDTTYMVNLSKFGSYWFYLQHELTQLIKLVRIFLSD
ncbi:hypothetical protein J3Q64DRAFT_1737402, partial [Phycomyces blakesleeanus]